MTIDNGGREHSKTKLEAVEDRPEEWKEERAGGCEGRTEWKEPRTHMVQLGKIQPERIQSARA
jgi:hypothetical protein